MVSCGPDEYTYCYQDDDEGQWVFQATGSQRIGIRFLSGSLAGEDAMRVEMEPTFSVICCTHRTVAI